MTGNKLFIGIMLSSLTLVIINSCKEKNNDAEKSEVAVVPVSKETLENEAWQMEEQYWNYVGNNDTTSYKKLWHDAFIGYPSFGDGVSDKSKIASWIPKLYEDKSRIYSVKLNRKAVNSIADVVIVFYDYDRFWTDEQNNILEKNTFKITHTWKKVGDTWLILGGMAADKIK